MKTTIQSEEYRVGDTFQVIKADGKNVFSPIYSFVKIGKIKEEGVIFCTFEVKKEGKKYPQEIYFPINTPIKKLNNKV